MPEFVENCPRCGAQNMTFDLIQENQLGKSPRSGRGFRIDCRVVEVFCVCRKCEKSTVFTIWEKTVQGVGGAFGGNPVLAVGGAVNRYADSCGPVTLKDIAAQKPPADLPDNIHTAFQEGATCLAVGCFNAACAMFRLCIDLAAKEKLAPISDVSRTVKNGSLKSKLDKLKERGELPPALHELSTCIKDYGNDGVHDGTLQKVDAENLLDFTRELLEHLYTNPAKLKLATDRRAERRAQNKTSANTKTDA